jgi:hypothetical protein
VGEGDLERDLRSVAALSELSLVRRTATVVVVTVEVAVTALHDVTCRRTAWRARAGMT